jgi:hypothetical protein
MDQVKLKWLDMHKDVCYVADVPDGSVNLGIDWPCPVDGSRVAHVDTARRVYVVKLSDSATRTTPWPRLVSIIAADNSHVTVYEGGAPGFRVPVEELPGVEFWSKRVTSCFVGARVVCATGSGS